MGFGVSLLLIGVGAILVFALETTVEGIDLETVGWILMGLGAFGLVLSMVLWSSWSFSGTRRRSVTERRSTAGGDVIVEDEKIR